MKNIGKSKNAQMGTSLKCALVNLKEMFQINGKCMFKRCSHLCILVYFFRI